MSKKRKKRCKHGGHDWPHCEQPSCWCKYEIKEMEEATKEGSHKRGSSGRIDLGFLECYGGFSGPPCEPPPCKCKDELEKQRE